MDGVFPNKNGSFFRIVSWIKLWQLYAFWDQPSARPLHLLFAIVIGQLVVINVPVLSFVGSSTPVFLVKASWDWWRYFAAYPIGYHYTSAVSLSRKEASWRVKGISLIRSSDQTQIDRWNKFLLQSLTEQTGLASFIKLLNSDFST